MIQFDEYFSDGLGWNHQLVFFEKKHADLACDENMTQIHWKKSSNDDPKKRCSNRCQLMLGNFWMNLKWIFKTGDPWVSTMPWTGVSRCARSPHRVGGRCIDTVEACWIINRLAVSEKGWCFTRCSKMFYFQLPKIGVSFFQFDCCNVKNHQLVYNWIKFLNLKLPGGTFPSFALGTFVGGFRLDGFLLATGIFCFFSFVTWLEWDWVPDLFLASSVTQLA